MVGYHLSTSDQKLVRALHKQGKSGKYIAKQVKCSESTVSRCVNRECIDPVHRTKVGVGRKRKLSEYQQDDLHDILIQNNKLGSRRLVGVVKKRLRVNLHDRSIRRYAARTNLQWKKPTTKPLLSDTHRQKRLTWAKRHRHTDWSKWVFSDETTIDVYGNNYGQRVERGNKVIEEKVKYPPKVHCWWAISTHAHFTPYIFTDNLTADLYLSILQQHLSTTRTHTYPIDWVFQQDNDPKHKAKIVQTWLNSHVPRWTADWPAQSPDLNPMENVWSIVKAHVHTQKPSNKQQLVAAIKKACRNITQHTINQIISSMSTRINQTIQAKGSHTNY